VSGAHVQAGKARVYNAQVVQTGITYTAPLLVSSGARAFQILQGYFLDSPQIPLC
jgi:hypothetical protein